MITAQRKILAINLKWKQQFKWWGKLYQKVGYKKTLGLALLARDMDTNQVIKFPKGYLVIKVS